MRLVRVKAIMFAIAIITSLLPVVVADNQIELVEENSTPLQATIADWLQKTSVYLLMEPFLL